MNIKGVIYTVRSNWWDDKEDPDQIGAQFVRLLDRIESAVPVKTVWLIPDFANVDVRAGPDMEEPAKMFLEDARTDIAALVERNDIKDEDGSTDPRNGYRLFARGTEDGGEFGSSRSIDVHIHAGSQWDNEVDFGVGSLLNFPDPDLVTYPIYRGALEAMASTFPCPYAWAKYYVSTEVEWIPTSTGGERAPPSEPSDIFDGIWIAYLSSALATGFTPPADLFPEPTPGGGLILSAVKDHIDPTNPDHVRRSKILGAIMTTQAARPSHLGKIYPGHFPPRVGPY